MQAAPPTQKKPASNLFAEYERKLRSPNPWVRREAAEGLSAFGMDAEPLLRRAMADTDDSVCKAAVEALGRIEDPRSTDLLLEALEAGVLEVRVAAAKILGARGDRRALLPLMAAYRSDLVTRPVLTQQGMGPVRLALWAVMVAVTGWQWVSGHGNLGNLLFTVLITMTTFSRSRVSDHPWRTVLEAILQIAERNPCPEVSRLLPDLQSRAADRLLTHPGDRDVARVAAAKVEALTSGWTTLPLPAKASAPALEPLPVPAEASTPMNDAAGISRPVERT